MSITFREFKHAFSNDKSISNLSRTYAENNFRLYLESKSSNKNDYKFNEFNQGDMDVLIKLYVSAYNHISDIIINNKNHKNLLCQKKNLSLHT